jgi:hypothetical protein
MIIESLMTVAEESLTAGLSDPPEDWLQETITIAENESNKMQEYFFIKAGLIMHNVDPFDQKKKLTVS